ncbi:MAG: TRAP transporter small permease subunit [Deltaproteobacteria bacterium]|mgnify:CR=1 FL=1|nr:TRAP transporter small permease subunit [Deltaproteobacteria bacterium]MBW1923718.1 TRAP transporter small permease subunit [Deltaproteobacteria bacterium]MBW1950530.1 TRAP transporter small permease subunit [Deltaproteobacteria bacterium]MBW2008487.1 TRAP transporter small permease subunit [Deltaproteobacteria bacterium]MBW2103802.1 TRAP transporter small permease subunit [Deltaproteobacteria bacterium]
MSRIISAVNEWLGRAVSFLLAAMMLTICYEVVARYFFDRPTTWSMELNTYLLSFYCLLGGGFTLLRNGHVSVDILFSRFHFRTKAVLNCLTSIFFFMFVLGLLWMGWDMAANSWKYHETSGTILDWPLFPTQVMVPVGSFLLLLQGLVKIVADFRTALTGIPPGDAHAGSIFHRKPEE